MKFRFIIALFWFGVIPFSGAAELTVTNNLAVVIPSSAGHSVPVLDYLRRLDRVFRQVVKLDATVAGEPLTLKLSDKIAPGTWNFRRDGGASGSVTLEVPVNYRLWGQSPELGRAITAAILQSRLGNMPDTKFPASALWVPDGLWAEFVQREADGQRIFRVLWLEGMRNIVEAGGKIHYSSIDLKTPDKLRPGSVEWTLYSERARLLLDITGRMASGKTNVLRDYIEILNNTSLDPDLAFERTIGEAAVRKISNVAPDYAKMPPEKRLKASRRALEILSERALFNIHIPLSANTVRRRLQNINQVPYRRDDGFAATAELADLPLLYQKYDACKPLPRLKMEELNELGILTPKDFHLFLMALTTSLDRIGTIPTTQAVAAIKHDWAALMNKIEERQKVEEILQTLEKRVLPPLFENHFSLDAPPPADKISPRIDAVLDRAESEL